MAINLVITSAGREALVNASNSGTNAVQITSCKLSGTHTAPSAAATTLPATVKTIATLSGDQVAANVIHLVVRDESADAYTVRSFGLCLADGTLFAIYGQATPIIEKSSAATLLLALDVTLADIAATEITFGNTNFIDPPATVDRAGVVRLATNAEAGAGTDASKALTPANVDAILAAPKLLAKLVTVDGAGSGLDADLLDGRQLGTVGDAVPSLAGNNQWDGAQTFTGTVRTFVQGVQVGPLGGVELYNGLPENGWWAGMRAYSPNIAVGLDFVELRFFTTYQVPRECMRLTVDGRLGIGTTVPTAKLHVEGGAHVNGPATINGIIRSTSPGIGAVEAVLGGHEVFNRAVADGWWAGWRACVPTGAEGADIVDLRFFTTRGGPAERMRITSAGAVGIGTTTPAYLFHVAGTGGFDGALKVQGSVAWHAGNDGAGSGLDADLLDGRQAAEFALLADATFTGPFRLTGARGLEPPDLSYGSDGALYLQVNPAAGTVRLWHRLGSQWLSSN